jgi:hypothetical protein
MRFEDRLLRSTPYLNTTEAKHAFPYLSQTEAKDALRVMVRVADIYTTKAIQYNKFDESFTKQGQNKIIQAVKNNFHAL